MAPSSHEPKGRQGFASMSPELRREISRKGGQSIPAQKRAFSQRKELGRSARRKGGVAIGRNRHSRG
ncbi:MAG TPA: KGG domain-containing protein [Hyphomicrobiaceae bacterium]|nr:KGG domain-containing protein [Hyphomicrobiaceae bacterium]